jgi:hypothetical protein
MKALAIAVALLATGCGPGPEPPELPIPFACYRDGAPTLRLPATRIRHEEVYGPGTTKVEVWVVRTTNGDWYRHAAHPDEVCAPEPPPKPG